MYNIKKLLTALRKETDNHWWDDIDAILAQPEQGPVAWMWTRKYGDGGYTDKVFQFLCDAEEYAKDSANLKTPDIITPLYTSPPKREPLSDEEIYTRCCAMDNSYTCIFIDGVEWAEQQHGIRSFDDE